MRIIRKDNEAFSKGETKGSVEFMRSKIKRIFTELH